MPACCAGSHQMHKGDAVFSIKIGRRKFIKSASSALFGVTFPPFWSAERAWAGTKEMPAPEYRVLGRTGLKVTAVAMGVMNCSDPAVLLRAYDLGVNFFDTAYSYMAGKNEEMVGKVFRGKRDKILIQTKIRLKPTEKENRASVETSLRRLQTDYVDVLLWHAFQTTQEVSNSEAFEFMKKLKKEGKVRFHGFSTHDNVGPLLRQAAKSSIHDVAEIAYNFTHSKELKEAVRAAAESGIGIVAMKTQAGGYKSEKIGTLTPHQAALKIVLSNHSISTAIPGVKTIDQIDECVAVMGTQLSRVDLYRLDQYGSYLHGRICTMCGGCIGLCPHGVAHQDLLRAVMYRDGYNDIGLVKELFSDGERVQKMRLCSDCSSCSIKCVRGLDIHAQLKSLHKMVS